MVNALSASGLGARAVEHAALVLSRALNQAKRWGYVSKNAVAGVASPGVKRRTIQPVDEQQSRALLEAVKGIASKRSIGSHCILGCDAGRCWGC